jgi:hypothetical protein
MNRIREDASWTKPVSAGDEMFQGERVAGFNVEVGIMTMRELLINEIEEVPEPLLAEVLDFVCFLKAKIAREKKDVAIMSESSLSKDWLRPEEDEAWQDL